MTFKVALLTIFDVVKSHKMLGNPTMRKEIPYLHLIRTLAIVLVVLLHTLNFHAEDITEKYNALMLYITRPCVPLFMMLSGALLINEHYDLLSFYKKRLSKIIVPLLFWGVVYALLSFVMHGSEELFFKELSLLPITYPKQYGGILWYLYMLIGIYLAIPFISKESLDYRKGMGLKIYLALWFMGSLVGVLRSKGIMIWSEFMSCSEISPSYDILQLFIGYLGYALLGYLLTKYPPHLSRTKISLAILFILIIFVVVTHLFKNQFWYDFTSPLSISMSYLVFLLLKDVAVEKELRLYSIIKKFSQMSFGIYLSHMLIFNVITVKIYGLGVSVFSEMLVFISTLFLSYGLTVLISKVDVLRRVIGN